jgi:hypothetical protein
MERRTASGWVSEGDLTAPEVETPIAPRWTNCAGFGAVTKLSGDGNTLLVAPERSASPDGEERCVAFVYRHGSDGWTLDGTLFPPGVGPAGSPTQEVCEFFGIEGVIDDDGDLLAIRANRQVDVFVRGQTGWSLEQDITLPTGAGCGETIGPREVALSGDGDTLLASDPDCERNGVFAVGRVYAYTRSGGGWSLTQTIESPEPQFQNEFGSVVTISDDGSTAAISTLQNGGLPHFSGAAWVYEHDAAGWHARTRISPTEPEAEEGFDCSSIVAGGQRIVCGAYDAVGFNVEQGSIYAFERPDAGWGATVAPPQRVFAPEGLAGDALGVSDYRGWTEYGVSDDGGLIDAPIDAANIASGAYPDDLIGYELTAPPVYSVPTVANVSPTSGGAGTTITIDGSNLTGATAVSIGGTPAASFQVESPTQITAVVPAGATSGPISVSTPGRDATSPEDFAFIAREGSPHVTSITPSEGTTTGGTAVTITGSNFGLDANVTIGGEATDVVVHSETEITAITPAQRAGSAEVVVSDEGGASTGGPDFTYVELAPSVSSVVPAEGPSTGGTAVTINGADFESDSTVTIGGEATDVTVRSNGEITAVTPAQPAGSHEVVVSDEAGSSAGGPTFTYAAPPTVVSVTPSEGPAKGHTRVTIRGSHFQAGAIVTIGAPATAVKVHSETEITAKTAAEPAGSYEVVVSEGRGTSSGGPIFTYAVESKTAAGAFGTALLESDGTGAHA